MTIRRLGPGDQAVVERLSYRQATQGDVPLLVAWHAEPEISRYWDDETFTADELRHRLAREAVDAWIVEEDGEPVGYLQSWWEEDEPRRGGLDGFLVPSARGRGIMPAVARMLAERLLGEGGDPSRSIRTPGTSAPSAAGRRPGSSRCRATRPTTSTSRTGC